MNFTSFKNIWVTTDWHINHKNIIKFENRPENFKELIIQNIQNKISDNDLIIHLGDVIFGQASELKEIMESLPGYYILTTGNHDRHGNEWFRNHGFDYVCKNFEFKDILFSHKPRDLKDWPNLKYNIHGHFHRRNREEDSRNTNGYPFYSNNHFLLSIEEMNYEPILLQDFMKLNKVDYEI